MPLRRGGQRVLGLEPHGGDGVADLVRDAAGHAAQGGQALVAAALLRGLLQLRAGLLEADAVAVEAVDDAVEFLHARAGQFGHLVALGLHELAFELLHMAQAAPQDQAQPQRGHQCHDQQHRQARVQAVLRGQRAGMRARHGPGGQVLARRGQRTRGNDQGLAAAAHDVGLRLLGAGRALGQLDDQRLLGRRHVALDAAAFVGGVGIGQQTALRLPDAAFDVRGFAQHQLQQHLQQIELRQRGRGAGNRLGITRRDGAARLLGHRPAGIDLGAGTAAVQHHHDHGERGAQGQQQGAEKSELDTEGAHGALEAAAMRHSGAG